MVLWESRTPRPPMASRVSPGLDLGKGPSPLSSCQAEPRTADTDQLAASFIFASKKTRQEKLWIMLERVKVSPFLTVPAGPGLDSCLRKLFLFLAWWLGAICWAPIGQRGQEALAFGSCHFTPG